jgi:hypothetical protein
VDLDDFCGEAAEERLRDLAWLGPRVFRHEAVIEEVMRSAPVLPARFATLFTSTASLRRFILEHRSSIEGFFAELGDKQEWGVKGLLERGGRGVSGVPRPALRSVSPGSRYFEEKRIEAQFERDFASRLKAFCRRAAAALGELAGDFRERKVPAPANGAAGAELLLNWAFLVSPEATGDFRRMLDELNGEAFPGLSLALTGPWPPYSFAPDLSGEPNLSGALKDPGTLKQAISAI